MCKNLAPLSVNQLKEKEFMGKRVVTFKDIDSVHGRVDGTARKRFNDNNDKMIENEDYYFVKPKDVETSEIRTSEINNAGTYLLTETGYLMLVKSFTDDLAWKVQRDLVNSYFKVKSTNVVNKNLNSVISEISSLIDDKLEAKLAELSTYYKPTHKNKIRIASYIKERLGIEIANDEYKQVKSRILILLDADKWEDVPFETLRDNMSIIDDCVNAIVGSRKNNQVSLFE